MIKFSKYMIIFTALMAALVLASCSIFGNGRQIETIEEGIEAIEEEIEVSPEPPEEPAEEPEQELVPEPEKVEEDLEAILFQKLLDFFEAVGNDDEYDYFSQQTKQAVGSEEEYISGAKSDVYFILKESTANIIDVGPKEVTVYQDRAILAVLMDRVAEGMEYEDEQVGYKFISEEGQWKFDAYYPLGVQIIALQPVEEEISVGSQGLALEFKVRSFFPIQEVILAINQNVFDQNMYDQEYELSFSYSLQEQDLEQGANTITAEANNIFSDEAEYSWQVNYQN